MAQSSPQVDPVSGASSNGDGRASDNRGLMVREHEMHSLMPYIPMGPGGMSIDGQAGGLSISQLIHALRRRWLLALIAGLLIGVPAAVAVWLVTPDSYEVAAWLRVGDDPITMRNNSGFRNPSEYEAYRKTQASQIKSPLVLLDAVNNLRTDPSVSMLRNEREPVKFLEDEISVVVPLEQELLLIKMRGKDSLQLVKIVNAVRDSYLSNVVEQERQRNLKAYSQLEAEYNRIDRENSDKSTILQSLKEKFGVAESAKAKYLFDEASRQSDLLMREMSKVSDDLAKAEMGLRWIDKQKESGGAEVPDRLVQMQLMRDQEIMEMTDRISRLQMALDMDSLAARRGDKDPTVKNWRKQIETLQRRKEAKEQELKPGIVRMLQNELNRDEKEESNPEKLKLKKEDLTKKLDELEKKYSVIKTEASRQWSVSEELKQNEDKIKELTAERAKVGDEMRNVRLALDRPARVQPYDKATPPEAPSQAFRILMTVFAAIVGFALGSGTVIGLEYSANRLSTGGELSSRTGLRVLGTVPNLEVLSKAKGLNGAAAMQGILAESIDSFRTILLQQSRADAPRVLLVTSAGDREGKTTVASHLAASLARSGRRTLLVDGDLRSPTIHAMFGAALEPGVCEMLRGEIDLEGAIQPTQVDGLMLVAAGQCDYHAIASLSKAPLTETLKKAREQFEFIIIDGAPVLTYADTLLLGAHVDAAVLSVRRDVSQMHKVHEARERMESVGIRVLGAVVNGITETSRRPAYALPAPV